MTHISKASLALAACLSLAGTQVFAQAAGAGAGSATGTTGNTGTTTGAPGAATGSQMPANPATQSPDDTRNIRAKKGVNEGQIRQQNQPTRSGQPAPSSSGVAYPEGSTAPAGE